MSRRWRVSKAVAAGLAGGVLAERWYARSRVVAGPHAPRLVTRNSTSDTVATAAGTIAIHTYGAANAPTVLLIHGWLCDGRIWHDQIEALADTYRVITLDLPGHGKSTPPGDGAYTMDLLGDAVAAVLAHVAPAEHVVVAGHSLGGMALLNAARRHGDARARMASVVLLSTASRPRRRRIRVRFGLDGLARFERLVGQLAPRLRAAAADTNWRVPANDLTRFLVRAIGLGPGVPGHVVAFKQQLLSDANLDAAFGLAGAIAGLNEDAGVIALDTANVPISVLTGRHDRITPPDLAARMLALGADECVELSHAGHLVPMEAAEVVNATLVRHLSALGPNGSTLVRAPRTPRRSWRLPWRPPWAGR